MLNGFMKYFEIKLNRKNLNLGTEKALMTVKTTTPTDRENLFAFSLFKHNKKQ